MATPTEVLTAPTKLVEFDLSGTLSPYSPDPDRIQLFPPTSSALPHLSKNCLVCVVTGRQARDARKVLGIDIPVFGLYGAEFLPPGKRFSNKNEKYERWFAHGDDVAAVVSEHRPALLEAGVIIQAQGPMRMLHWASLKGGERERAYVLAERVAAEARDAGLAVYQLSTSLDIRPGQIDKDAALDWALELYPSVRRAIHVGDDTSDVAAFQRLRQHEESGRLDAVSCVGVLHPDRPQLVRDEADMTVNGTEGVTAFINQMAELRFHGA
jgi:trehalose-phosphatase